MIYPTATGKPDESARLSTLESVWIQGKLSMWGRWSYIGRARMGSMFTTLLASQTLSKSAIKQILSQLKASGMSDEELRQYFVDLLSEKQQTNLVFCTDSEGLMMDEVIANVLVRNDNVALFNMISDRYRHRMSKKSMARKLNEKHPEWSLRTCESRISVYLQVAESTLYIPMCEKFDRNPQRFRLQGCARVA